MAIDNENLEMVELLIENKVSARLHSQVRAPSVQTPGPRGEVWIPEKWCVE